MSALATLSSLRAVARHPWQVGLSILGIALGVAVVVGIDLAAASSLRGFRLAGDALAGRATHEVRGGSAGVPAALFAELSIAFPGVPMAPVVEFPALVVGERRADPGAPRTGADAPRTGADAPRTGAGAPRTGAGALRTTLTVFGADPFSEAALRPWIAALEGDARAGAPLELLRAPATGFLSADLAREQGVAAGDSLTLRVESRLARVRVLGLIAPGQGEARLALANLLVVDVATAQELLGRPDRLSRIDLSLGEDSGALAQRIAARLPPDVALEAASLRRGGLEELSRAFRLNLRALSLLALFVGVFLVYNTMTFSVVQRRPLIASLRTLGVTRGEVFRIVAGEALWLGVLGTALGLALGVQLAGALLGLVTRTMNDLYFVVSVREVHVDWALLAEAAALGVGATLVGALTPAFEATRERPRLALAASTLESGWVARLPRLVLLGAVAFAVALLLFLWPGAGLVPPFLGLLCLLVGAGLWTPPAAVLLARAAAPVLGRALGLFGRHAARGIEAHLSRTSVAIAALAVALSATIGMGVMIDSFRATFVRWLERSVEADVYCSAPTLVSSHNESTLAPETVTALCSAPGVVDWTTYRGFETRADGARVHAAAITLNPAREASFDFLDALGEPADSVWPRFRAEDAVIVSEAFAYHRGVAPGDRTLLATDRGPRAFVVLATHRDFTSDSGVVLLSRATYERHFDDRGVTSLELFAAPGEDPEALVARLRALVPEDQAVFVRSRGALRESSLAVFERTFQVTGVLRLLATLVAFVGTLSALLSLELERARELGVLRAQGVTPAEVRRLVIAETGLAGLIAGLVALPLGAAIALVLSLVINQRSFGWTLDLRFDPLVFVSALLLSVGAALLAGVVPAWRMSRSRPALALRGD